MAHESSSAWKQLSLGSGIFLLAVTVAAIWTQLWVLTAIPVGFLFGFFLERSDLCGASAISEVLLMKDARKAWGIWVLIVVSMLMFALGSELGWIALNPKPLIWANYLVGGLLFGIGMVLAGGCVSGSLFKAGQGNLNSMAALIAIPLGVAAVEYGPLHELLRELKTHVVKNAEGGSVTVASATNLSFGVCAVIIAALTVGGLVFWRRGRPAKSASSPPASPLVQRVLTRPWKPWISGIAIGLLALAAYTSSAASGRNYPLGTTHGVLHAELLVTDAPVRHVWAPKPKVGPATSGVDSPTAPPTAPPSKKVVWWLVASVVFLVVGSHVSARLRGSYRLLPKPPEETIVAFLGGLLVGAGAALATGCVVGNIMSGVAMLSVGNLLFLVVVVVANLATTRLYLMGRSA